MRRVALLLAGLVALHLFAGCGGKFKMPTEIPSGAPSADKSYLREATWTGMGGVRDLVYVPQGIGGTVYVLFNTGVGSGNNFIRSYPRFANDPPPARPGYDFGSLFNPVAMCFGGDGFGSADNRIYVLDQGDTCLARSKPGRPCTYQDWTPNDPARVFDLEHYWRVREDALTYGSQGAIPETVSTFTDTSVAYVHGIAADAQGRVYVSCLTIQLVPDPVNPVLTTRSFVWAVRRYLRGPRYPGVFPGDKQMPGSNWHRDTTWTVGEGAGDGFVRDPRGIFWSSVGNGALFVADNKDVGNSWVQKLSDQLSSTPLLARHVEGPYPGFQIPEDVTADLAGFFYVADTQNRRVLRFDPGGELVQRVDLKPDPPYLRGPTSIAADDSLVYVGDPVLGVVVRYKRLR
jgi:hypothetical protein